MENQTGIGQKRSPRSATPPGDDLAGGCETMILSMFQVVAVALEAWSTLAVAVSRVLRKTRTRTRRRWWQTMKNTEARMEVIQNMGEDMFRHFSPCWEESTRPFSDRSPPCLSSRPRPCPRTRLSPFRRLSRSPSDDIYPRYTLIDDMMPSYVTTSCVFFRQLLDFFSFFWHPFSYCNGPAVMNSPLFPGF